MYKVPEQEFGLDEFNRFDGYFNTKIRSLSGIKKLFRGVQRGGLWVLSPPPSESVINEPLERKMLAPPPWKTPEI